MGKKKKPAGFHTPFADLKLPSVPKPAPKKAPEPKKRTTQGTQYSDDALFSEIMDDVVPINQSQRTLPKKSPARPAVRERSPAEDDAMALEELYGLVETDSKRSFTVQAHPQGGTMGRAHGVNAQLLKQLQSGDISPRRHLDLHGKIKSEAFKLLKRFIRESRQEGEYCVLVITGKGHNSPDGRSIIQEALPLWLTRSPIDTHILAFSPAQPRDGGGGAFYVLLKKFL
ncbi:MAG: Smr/MutS family protein [Myxococcota bacterium]|nr:Smr/MutS family protein [Myxococcota bacterium]